MEQTKRLICSGGGGGDTTDFQTDMRIKITLVVLLQSLDAA
jgi:hypothetical protein